MNDQPSRILVVDDEVGIGKSCQKVLGRQGCIVDSVLNAEAALQKLQTGRYEVVLTDLRMPGMSGMQLMEKIVAGWPETEVIMITGYATVQNAVEAMKIGAFDYIPKPFDPEEISGVVSRALRARQLKKLGTETTATVSDRKTTPEPVLREVGQATTLTQANIEKMWCIKDHSWVRVEEGGAVVIGVDSMYLRALMGAVEEVELPNQGARLKQGEPCARIKVSSTTPGVPEHSVHNVWSPVGGVVAKVNEDVRKKPELAFNHPYGCGWLVGVQPLQLETDLKNISRFVDSMEGKVARRVIEAHK